MSRLSDTATRVLGEGEATASPSTDAPPKRAPGRPRKHPRPEEKKSAERPPYVASEASIAAATLLGATVWRLMGTFLPFRSLTEEEANELGKALDPIFWKYVPVLANWQAEINLAVVIVALVGETRITKPKAEPIKAEQAVETSFVETAFAEDFK